MACRCSFEHQIDMCSSEWLPRTAVCEARCHLAGDQQSAAEEVSAAVGIAKADTYGRVPPAGKADCVSKLQAGGASVAMIGDGVNDTAALAQVAISCELVNTAHKTLTAI